MNKTIVKNIELRILYDNLRRNYKQSCVYFIVTGMVLYKFESQLKEKYPWYPWNVENKMFIILGLLSLKPTNNKLSKYIKKLIISLLFVSNNIKWLNLVDTSPNKFALQLVLFLTSMYQLNKTQKLYFTEVHNRRYNKPKDPMFLKHYTLFNHYTVLQFLTQLSVLPVLKSV